MARRRHLSGGFGRRMSLVAVLVLAGSAVGCAYPRLNHLHSDVDQRWMDTAVANFKAFTEDAGVYVQRRKNLQADTAFRRTVANTHIFNTDERGLNDFHRKSWRSLLRDLATGFGLKPPHDLKPPQEVALLKNIVDQRIPLVRARLGAIADTLEALSTAEDVIRAELLKDIQAARTAVAALGPSHLGPPTPRARLLEFLKLYQQYRQALREAGKEYRKSILGRLDSPTEPALERAIRRQLDLLASVDASRDPEGAYAIVAAVGAGLDDESFRLLTEYGRYLDKHLAELKAKLPPAKGGGGVPSITIESLRLAQSAALTAQQRIVRRRDRTTPVTTSTATVTTSPADRQVPTVEQGIEKFRTAVLQAASTAAAAHSGSVSGLRALAVGEAAAQDAGIREDRERANPSANSSAFTTVKIQALKLVSTDGSDALARITRELQELRAVIPNPAQRAAGGASHGPSKIATDSEPKAAAEAQSTTEPKGTEARHDPLDELAQAILNAALLNSDLAKGLGGEVGTLLTETTLEGADPAVKKTLDIVTAIFKQGAEHKQRVGQFLADILTIDFDLHTENKRHYDALRAILGRELERWELLADSASGLNKRYEAKLGDKPFVSPFKDGLPVFIDDTGPTVCGVAGAHPRVAPDDRIVDSLRMVALSGQGWHEVKLFKTPPAASGPTAGTTVTSPAGSPPASDGAVSATDVLCHVFGSNTRARSAVEILTSYLYMMSTNHRFALEDAIQLRNEIGEHDIALDQVGARAREAKLRYDLTKEQAYHATGITSQDIQTLVQFIQAALTGWIGAKVN